MTTRPKHHERLPAHQLAAAVDRIIERADRPAALFSGPLSPGSIHSAGPAIRERLGINDRIHYGWRIGSRRHVGIDLADQVLTRAGLFWWDVWNEDTVRLHALVATTYGHSAKTNGRSRRRYTARYPKSTVRYGDLGPDVETLEAIRALWEPAWDEVAA